MTKQWWIPLLGVVVAAAGLAFGQTGTPQNGFTLLQYHNADAKFLGEQIITSVDEGIRILDLEGETVAAYDGLEASWLYVQEEDPDYLVAYSNHANETHILRIRKDNWLDFSDQTVLKTDTLAIDPILIKVSDGYLLTNTEIEGTINNPDPDGDNGFYTVKLYHSPDLEHWEYRGDIISQKKNTEDGDLRLMDGVLYYFFEEEDYDKGPSKIQVMVSRDEGMTWSEKITLLPNDSDHEMASCEWNGERWRLYFSCDIACVGESYQGASAYYADYTRDFEQTDGYHLSEMPDNEAVRLYEVKETDGQIRFLFARNFLTDCDLLYRTIESED